MGLLSFLEPTRTFALTGLRLLEGNFVVIRRVMGVAKARGPEAAARLRNFVAEQVTNGFVDDAIARHGIDGVALPAS